jgi:hypothetical protein
MRIQGGEVRQATSVGGIDLEVFSSQLRGCGDDLTRLMRLTPGKAQKLLLESVADRLEQFAELVLLEVRAEEVDQKSLGLVARLSRHWLARVTISGALSLAALSADAITIVDTIRQGVAATANSAIAVERACEPQVAAAQRPVVPTPNPGKAKQRPDQGARVIARAVAQAGVRNKRAESGAVWERARDAAKATPKRWAEIRREVEAEVQADQKVELARRKAESKQAKAKVAARRAKRAREAAESPATIG